MSKVRERTVGKLTEYTFEFPQKPEKKTWKQVIYDEKSQTYFGRTKKSWGYLFLFYGIYFIVLFSLVWLCMSCLFYTLNEESPKYQLVDSLIGVNPGLGYRPMPDEPERGAMVHYKVGNKTEMGYWTKRLDKFLAPYANTSLLPGEGKNHMSCEYGKFLKSGKVCSYDFANLGPCSPAAGYGYNASKPCVFMKLNRIFGWIPEYFNDIESLPDDMPEDLAHYIRSLPEQEREQVWISCNGVYPGDREAVGSFAYFPSRGLPSYHFPYTNTLGYISPLVAVQFTNPTAKQMLFVECRAWAKNIIYHGGSRLRMGSVQFTMLVD